MSKVLLIVPPCIELYKGIREVIPKDNPLGLLYLASFLEKNHIKVDIYDSFAENASMRDIEKKISVTEADVIGITSVTSTIREAIEIAKLAKRYGKTTVLGGIHFTAYSTKTLEKYDCFDYGVIGEGELTLYELVGGKNISEINGLAYKRGSEIIINKKRELIEDLSIIPHPARHLLKNELYSASDKIFSKNKMFFDIITARGCPFHCTFCASKVIWGTKIRYRPVEDIITELEELKAMGMEQLRIVDDTFTLDINRVKHITKKIKDLNIEWGCNARVNNFTPEMVQILKDSNCSFIEFGVESGNQEILNIMKKGITLEQIRKAVKLTKKANIKISCSFIIGNLGETEKTIKDTIQFAKELYPDFVFFNILTPYPGTEVYEIAKRKGYLKKDFEEYTNPKYSDPVLDLPTMDAAKLRKYSKKAFRSFYLNPRYILKIICRSLTSFSELKRNFRFFKSFINISKEKNSK